MLVKRWGANRNSGYTAIIKNKEFSASWSKAESLVELTVKRVSDPNGNGQYNYEVNLSVEEIGKLLEFLSNQALKNSPEVIAEKLAPYSRALLRLLIASGGIGGSSS